VADFPPTSSTRRARVRSDNNGGKLTGWPRPAMAFSDRVGLSPMRIALLLAMAISGILVGYFVGKYLAPAERFATPPTAEQKQSRSAPDYEERLPSDIVIQSNGAITRIQLPTPDAEIDFGSYERDAAPLSAPRDKNAPQKAKEEPDTPETAALTPQDGGPVVKPKPKLAVKPVQLVRAMPDDIAALQASDAAALPAWQRFAVPASLDTRPKIVIVMDDLGLDRRRTRRTWQLPGPLTLSFMAYAEDLDDQTKSAKKAGHELMLHVPMEPSSATIDPGPNVLLSGMAKTELKKNIAWNLDQVSGYVGINNHMGSRFTADTDGMRTVADVLKQRGLLFLDSVTAGNTVAHDVARDAGIPFAVRNVFIDHEDDVKAIERQLRRVEEVARETGLAVAIGHPREHTLAVLKPWLKSLDAAGFQLVPISAVARIAP
jgi:polysaccharide deacetylase 2 family uncharacterized protein YibQ